MMLIDTNVISEPVPTVPDPQVAEWFDYQALETLYLPAITGAELRFGFQLLPGCSDRSKHGRTELNPSGGLGRIVFVSGSGSRWTAAVNP
ncbi:MAG: type II toxin-antitoxin system VapC family toxin [Acidobacteriia bacterium]|nr:type II toxin-antitoxin system VapC family toxin [Terriglobia bacterium]MYG03886.1 type II toxin-antitoxin system VapC family toxin [Terriglobia bacterium]MYK10792.1 type II toxin-antitoxin system VapC family toxin [Terriglobia bacterium]